MKFGLRRTVALTLAIAFVLTTATVTSADDEAQPTIVIDEMRHDLGEVFEQEVYKHTFKVKNTGTAVLEINKVKPG